VPLCAWRLQKEIARFHGPAVRVSGEADVDHGNDAGHPITDMDGLGVVALWNTERWRWNHLLPTQAHVCSEDEHGGNIKEAPAEGLEDLELETVDIAHIGCIFELAVRHPEEVDWMRWVEDCLQMQVYQVWWWADCIWLCHPEAELEQVDGHEREECNT